MDEEIARILSGQAESDQVLATVVILAKICAHYRKTLLDEGVPEDQAYMLALQFQNCLLLGRK